MKREQRGKKERRKERNTPSSNKNAKRQRGVGNAEKAVFDFNQPSTPTDKEKTGNEDAFSGDLTACDEGSESDEIRTKIMRDAECQADTVLKDSECQTTKLEYMFQKSTYRAPDKEFFDSDEKVRFCTGLPSLEVPMVVFDQVPRVYYCTLQNLGSMYRCRILPTVLLYRFQLFLEYFPFDCGNGQETVCLCLLARQATTLEDNAPVFLLCLWQENNCCH